MEGKLQFDIRHEPAVDGIGSGSCWIQFYLLPRKKRSSDVWVAALFFPSQMTDCILNGCHNLRVPFYIQVPCLKKLTALPKRKEISLSFPASWISSVLYLLLVAPLFPLFSLLFPLLSLDASQQGQLHYCYFYTCFWTSWAWNARCCTTVLYLALYEKVYKNTRTCGVCICLTVFARHVN